MKLFKKIIKTILLLLILFVVYFLGAAFVPIVPGYNGKLGSYEHVMKDAEISNSTKVIDIAMLGAHDAFTSEIGIKSIADPNDTGIVTNETVMSIGKSIVYKQSKAQVANAKEMLFAGVRYFDVRLSNDGDIFYTVHGLISTKMDSYVTDIVEFLNTHPEEFIIFDIQNLSSNKKDCYSDDEEVFNKLFSQLTTLGLMNYVNYNNVSISDLTYGDVTNNQTKGGVVILAKTDKITNVYYRDGNANQDPHNTNNTIRSYWHNTNSNEEIINGIKNEVQFVKENNINNILRVNQAQRTGAVGDYKIVYSVLEWSLINMASITNAKLVKNKVEFKNNLKYLPIFMVDNATSSFAKFNAKANNYIIEYNKAL